MHPFYSSIAYIMISKDQAKRYFKCWWYFKFWHWCFSLSKLLLYFLCDICELVDFCVWFCPNVDFIPYRVRVISFVIPSPPYLLSRWDMYILLFVLHVFCKKWWGRRWHNIYLFVSCVGTYQNIDYMCILFYFIQHPSKF